MAGSSLIGNLSVLLTMDTSAFEKGSTHAQRLLAKTQKEFDKVGSAMQRQGQMMSTYLTLPILAIGAAGVKMAADFETSMNQVGIATQASGKEMAQMKELALQIGSATTKSASEASSAMEMLAKAGMSTTDILNGGAKAAVALAEAAGSELDPAAAAITDTMQQFKKTTADLPNIINNITGAVNQSKFDFADFQLGMAQAGGVAASAGVEFEDFTAALAATASQFASGSDAGTSMKTFLMRLTPDTKKAAAAMKEVGFNAYDAAGNLLPLRDIAQQLQEKFAGMAEGDRTAMFKQMFGTDAIRTAIGLMQQGAAGIDAMNAKIQATDAAAQAAQRMKGLNAELEKLKGALETLAIRMADSGLLAGITSVVTAIGSFVDWLGKASPETLKWTGIILGLVAAVGPLWLTFGTGIKAMGLMLPLVMKLGPVFSILATGMKYLIPVIGGVARALLLMLGNPIILAAAVVIGGIYLAWKNWDKIVPIVKRVYEAVKKWFMDRLGPIFEWVGKKVAAVTGFFKDMYVAVVGNSYVPDMVTEIGQHMAKLDGNMVQPAKKGTKAVEEAFSELQQRVQGIMQRLFPAQAKENQFNKDLADLEAYAKRTKMPVDQLTEAIKRLKEEYDPGIFGPSAPEIDTDAERGRMDERNDKDIDRELEVWNDKMDKQLAAPAKKKTTEVIEAFRDMSIGVVDSLRNMSQQLKSGDILGSLVSILDMVLNVLTALSQAGIIKTAPAPANIAGARAAGGPVVRGRTYLVGEKGPELFSAGQSGRVISNDNLGGGGKLQIVPSPYFDVVVDGRAQRVAAPMAYQAAVMGAGGATTMATRRERQTLR